MTEKAAVVRLADRWRAYVSLATPGGPHWWVGLLEAERLEDLATAELRATMPGDPATTGLKDPVVRATSTGFEAWVCAHDLTVEGQEDRMSTLHATSTDGMAWTFDAAPALTGTPGGWDARGARITTVLADGGSRTTAGRAPRRTGSSAAGSPHPGRAGWSRTATVRWPTCATWRSSPCRTVRTGSGTRPDGPTAGTSSGPSSSPHRDAWPAAPAAGQDGRMETTTERFRAARDQLIAWREDYPTARAEFTWPRFEQFNFGLDWFDQVAAGERADHPALWIVEQDGSEQKVSWAQMSRRSGQVATWLRGLGVARGDRVVLMLGNQVELWETILACIKLGAVMIPCTPLLGTADLRDRVERGGAKHVVVGAADTDKLAGVADGLTRVAVPGRLGAAVDDGWTSYDDSLTAATGFEPDGPTSADDTLLLYFTSGTTSKPKLVEHTHTSYPVGHLSTMYWIGLEPGDVHLNISSPGWAKHAWSNVFAPWIAEATIFIHNTARFDPASLLEVMGGPASPASARRRRCGGC